MGLKEFGEWQTIYEGLSQLPEQVQKSWFAFDHYFSDDAFPLVLKQVYKKGIKKLLDIGGNTGKWAIASISFFALTCAYYNHGSAGPVKHVARNKN